MMAWACKNGNLNEVIRDALCSRNDFSKLEENKLAVCSLFGIINVIDYLRR